MILALPDTLQITLYSVLILSVCLNVIQIACAVRLKRLVRKQRRQLAGKIAILCGEKKPLSVEPKLTLDSVKLT